ncbi:MAG: leucine-rich repeat domain-containing protein [Lachnospiraceae bacterium]|nr:leucine-rich repeat domain-containing protein [Lachnospiraceae bacterium]
MRRSIRKAVAFLTFLAMALEIFVVPDVTSVKAAEAETEFVYDEYYGYVCDVLNPTPSLTIPSEDTDVISLGLYEKGVKSITVEKGFKNVSIYGAEDLEEIILPSTVDYLSISGAPKLKELNIPTSVSEVNLYEFGGETLDVPSNVSTLVLDSCENLKSVKLKAGLSDFTMWGCPNVKVTVPSTVNYMYCDSYKGVSISPDNPKYSMYEESVYEYDNLWFASPDKATINIKPGTKGILSDALCKAYAATSINIPDSVEFLGYGAFSGATKIKSLKLPKSLLCIYSYAFEGLGADSIEIPSSVYYIDENAFGGYNGVISLENGYNSEIVVSKGAVYRSDYSSLLYYPKTRTALNLEFNCLTIAYSAINGCAFSTLDLPDGMTEFYCDTSNCKKLKTINFPESMMYISDYSLAYASPVSIAKYTVDKSNALYSSHDGCLYSKDKDYLYSIPKGKKDVKVARGCVTICYYAFGNRDYYNPDTDTWYDNKVNIELPGTIRDIQDGLYYIETAKVDCGTTAASIIENYNDETWWNHISYEFADSSKDILRKIVVSDDIQIKKTDKNEYVTYTVPVGLKSVSAFTPLHEGTNIYVKVSFTSTKKSVCKVNKKTGKLSPVKKGTATIKVKCELPDGTTKTYKTKVTVK